MRWPSVILLAEALAGCSLIYNPNNLPNPIDAPPADANQCMLLVLDVSPTSINEGQGIDGSPPALVVVHGHNIVNKNLHVALTAPAAGPAVQLDPVTDATASADGDYLAFSVTAHVDPTLSTDVVLDVTVSEDGDPKLGCATAQQTLAASLTLHGLPELMTGGTLTAPLAPLYSQIKVTDPVTLAGDVPAVLASVSSIKLAAVNADAGTGHGPGGKAGGANAGACPTPSGGGGAGTAGSGVDAVGGGGGGAGGAAMGSDGARGANGVGTGGAGGGGGNPTGRDQMASLADNAACAGGAGGVGGLLSIGDKPGNGGGGGGTVMLAAGGDLTVASISAAGGTAVSGTGGGGGGGAGAGGNVLLRTETGTVAAVATINVAAGTAGTPGGGTGSVGRVRWDAPDPASPNSQARRGPAFARLTSRVFTSATPTLQLVGTAGDGFTIQVIDAGGTAHDGAHASFAANGATIHPQLLPGHNQVCVALDNGAGAEGSRCVDVAFLP